jgi:hypothetical protein
MRLVTVVFPPPDGPTRPIISAHATSNDTLLSTWRTLVDELSAAFESSPSRDEVQEHVRSSLEMLHHEGLLR